MGKAAHPFIKKEWYNVRVPSNFDVAAPTLTPCNKAAGQKIPADSLRGRVFEISLGDLNQNASEQAWRKVRVQCEEVKGFDCFTNYNGLDITRDKLCTLVKKWHSTIEAFAQAKTNDGYQVRMFSIAFTRRQKRQVKATCYAENSQQKLIRQKMMEIMVTECQKSSLKDLPSRERHDQEGQGSQEAQVRSDQAHGALPEQRREADQDRRPRCRQHSL